MNTATMKFDIAPLQRHQLAEPHPGAHGTQEERRIVRVHVVRRVEERLDIVSGQRLNLRG